MNRYLFCLGMLVFVSSSALADDLGDCKKASEAIAPAHEVLAQCQQENVNVKCNAEASQIIEISITALEKCAPIKPHSTCMNIGDPRKICTSDKQCQRAAEVWEKYCAKQPS